jgi:hypothetical protein
VIPAIYHKTVEPGALGAGCRKTVLPTGNFFARDTQS